MIVLSTLAEIYSKGITMNADKIYAETIAKEYVPKLYYKTVALKKLDRKAKKRATVFACTFGVTMVLMLDTGICLSMQAIGGNHLPMLIAGIVIKLIGLVGISVNYPLYKKLLESDKQKYAFDIVQLANQIIEATEE